jgi:hypothetical protein
LQRLPITSVIIRKLEYFCKKIPSQLREIPETVFTRKVSKQKWSRKEILGHLIDSAIYNHQRFVRSQFEDVPVISYDQDKCVENNYYQETDPEQLISFWTSYNLQILSLIRLMPEVNFQKKCINGQRTETVE